MSGKNDLTSFVSAANSDSDNALESSYHISYRIAKTVKPHLIAEVLVQSCVCLENLSQKVK